MINKLLNGLSKLTSYADEITQEVVLLHFTIVTACIIGEKNNWMLMDTGLDNSAEFIIRTSEERFGKGCRPSAIILTHGHFDHVGSLKELADLWDVPVYAHEKELPYITGKKDYPQGDPTVDEGLVAKLSPAFPHKSIDIGMRAVKLPEDHSIPGAEQWEWIPTPGHTEGHISLFRRSDGTLIAGDAFTTTKQESFLSVLTQDEQVKGPPAYLTTDWEEAGKSIMRIKQLAPSLAIMSHGKPMKGDELSKHLEYLAENFEWVAIPDQGRFVDKENPHD